MQEIEHLLLLHITERSGRRSLWSSGAYAMICGAILFTIIFTRGQLESSQIEPGQPPIERGPI